jgi:hypothetical protein
MPPDQNPYAPPATEHLVIKPQSGMPKPTRPIIPAIIGMFTYGSTSPYALVLCAEQYLRWSTARPLLSTHIALPLSILGTLGWLSINIAIAPDAIRALMERDPSSYGSIGLLFWIADGAFLLWAYWRFRLFRKQEKQAPSEDPR